MFGGHAIAQKGNSRFLTQRSGVGNAGSSLDIPFLELPFWLRIQGQNLRATVLRISSI
jgi:hypothetical protein